MTFREIVELGFIGLGLKLVDKLVKDNIPNLHYKNLIKGFERYILPSLFIILLLCSYGVAMITKNHEAKKNILLGICAFIIVLGVMQIIEKRALETKSLQGN